MSFVVYAVAVLLAASCSEASSLAVSDARSSDYERPVMVGRIETPEVKESSGLAVSKCQPNVLWTHNDAGNDAYIYGMTAEGKHLGAWKVQNAQNTDWEDIESFKDGTGKCFLLIGDIGNNEEDRTELTVYRIPEPAVQASGTSPTGKGPLQTDPAETLKFSYVDSRNNAETLLVHPQTSDIYILTKTENGPAGIHKITPAFGNAAPVKTEKIGDISLPAKPEGLITGGSISADGSRVILCDVQNGYEFKLADGQGSFDVIWKQKPVVVNLGDRKQGEGVSYSADGTSIYASSEKKNAPLFQIKRK